MAPRPAAAVPTKRWARNGGDVATGDTARSGRRGRRQRRRPARANEWRTDGATSRGAGGRRRELPRRARACLRSMPEGRRARQTAFALEKLDLGHGRPSVGHARGCPGSTLFRASDTYTPYPTAANTAMIIRFFSGFMFVLLDESRIEIHSGDKRADDTKKEKTMLRQ